VAAAAGRQSVRRTTRQHRGRKGRRKHAGEGAHLKGALLAEAHLEGANLWKAHLEGARLIEAHLEAQHLDGTGFTILLQAHLQGANLWKAHLEGADLGGAHLEGACLEEAHLEGADLREAHLEGADLREVVGLTQEQLEQASGDATTKVADELRPAHWPAAANAQPEEPDNAK
jgi:uncharacterized protein YjbI with pentapeptide repeats